MHDDSETKFEMAPCKCCGYQSCYPICHTCFSDVIESFVKLEIIVTRTMLGYRPIASRALRADMNKYDTERWHE